MKKHFDSLLGTLLVLVFLLSVPFVGVVANEPDSAFIFAFSTGQNRDRDGLHLAWSLDGDRWQTIGSNHRFLGSDYGAWGVEKRMILPYLYRESSGLWHCVWQLNEYDGVIAHATSTNLTLWKPQEYYTLSTEVCLSPTMSKIENDYVFAWKQVKDGIETLYQSRTSDFKHFSPASKIVVGAVANERLIQPVGLDSYAGTKHRVSWKEIQGLMDFQLLQEKRNQLWAERASEDLQRFPNLKPLDIQVAAVRDQSVPMSDLLIGAFFEDISYAADGGLYAELIENRGFEYKPSDKNGRDPKWNATHSWTIRGENNLFTIDSVHPIHANNPHYAVVHIQEKGSLLNDGYDGIVVRAGEIYNLSLFYRSLQGFKGSLRARLIASDGRVLADANINRPKTQWGTSTVALKSKGTDHQSTLELYFEGSGVLHLDMISLFPKDTYKGRKNGLRKDLAEVIEAMQPRFVRFPGGCVAHGDGLHNMYRWDQTLGPLEARVPQRNIWNYHQSMGLGYYEYFQFCEDLGAEPVPVLPAGVPCQNSSCGGAGQQGGIPMCDMHDYVQEVLNLIEWANGDRNTTWGRLRAEAGHPEPFHLKYIGIGNEDLISEVFKERFEMIYNAVVEKYPEITVIGTVGPFFEGSDYSEGWKFATELGVPMVDEHYYVAPGWFIHNGDYYDRYDRSKPKVYLGEYAAHVPGRHNNMETALSEALYLTHIERNADVVRMTSYAPMLAKNRRTNWNPDLIYFDNSEVLPTVGYYVQKMFGQNAGSIYYHQRIQLSDQREGIQKRFGCSVVEDAETGDVIVKLVHALPVEAHVKLDLTSLLPSASYQVMCTRLQGEPNDRKAAAKEEIITLDATSSLQIPAYSFTVLRFKKK